MSIGDLTKFTGIHTALITPFCMNNHLDLEAFGQVLAAQIKDGIDGFVVAGTTGEAPSLDIKERAILVREAKKYALKQVVIAGAGSNNTKNAIDLQKIVEDAGADASLQVVPYYNKPSQEGLIAHFGAIAQEASIPIILYNASGRTGIDIAPETVLKLSLAYENIVGIKDANADMNRLGKLIKNCKRARPDFLILSGEDSCLLPFLALGADGIISVSSHLVAKDMLALYKHIKNNELISAQKIAYKIHDLCNLVFSHSNPIPIKIMLAKLALIKKYWRLPLCALRPPEEEALLKKFAEFEYLWPKYL